MPMDATHILVGPATRTISGPVEEGSKINRLGFRILGSYLYGALALRRIAEQTSAGAINNRPDCFLPLY